MRTGRAEFVGALLSHGPFAGAVGPILQSLDALDQIFDLISSRLAEHNLSLDRILADMAAAWAEMDFTSLPGTNVAIINSIAHVVVREGLVNEAWVAERCETAAFEQWRRFVAEDRNSPEAMQSHCRCRPAPPGKQPLKAERHTA